MYRRGLALVNFLYAMQKFFNRIRLPWIQPYSPIRNSTVEIAIIYTRIKKFNEQFNLPERRD